MVHAMKTFRMVLYKERLKNDLFMVVVLFGVGKIVVAVGIVITAVRLRNKVSLS